MAKNELFVLLFNPFCRLTVCPDYLLRFTYITTEYIFGATPITASERLISRLWACSCLNSFKKTVLESSPFTSLHLFHFTLSRQWPTKPLSSSSLFNAESESRLRFVL